MSSALTDSAWLKGLEWRTGACESQRETARAGDVEAFWAAHLAQVQSLWGRKRQQKHLDLWLTLGADSAAIDTLMAAEREEPLPPNQLPLACAVLAWAPERLSAATGVALYRQCHTQLADEQWGSATGVALDDVCDVQLQSELSVTYGLLCSDLGQSKGWIESGLEFWNNWLEEHTDTDGGMHARWLPRFVPILQSLARTELFLQAYGKTLLKEGLQQRLQMAIERMLSLVIPGRIITFDSISRQPNELDAALSVLGYKKASAVRKLLKSYSEPVEAASNSPFRAGDLPDESCQSDWTEWAVMRSSWAPNGDQVLICHDQRLPQIDIVLGGVPVFSGTWDCQVTIDGQPWTIPAEWSCVCAFHDEAADYLEILVKDEERDITLIRQAILNKSDGNVLLCELVKLPSARQIQFRSHLPCVGQPLVEQDALSPEQALTWGKSRVRVFPIAWPQDRFAPTWGRTVAAEDGLVQEFTGTTNLMWLPVMLDKHSNRRQKPCDWRSLTVAEDGQAVPPEFARAARLRVGREQWFYFHQTKPQRFPRSVLGHHTSHETVFARVGKDGAITPLVQVELSE